MNIDTRSKCLAPAQDGLSQLVRRLSAIVVIACSVVFSLSSLHWLLVGDSSLMHYIVFLMERGMAPYRDIVDVNMPGTYGVEWAAMHLFGTGSLAWRLFDLFLGMGIAVTMTVIAWPEDRLAGTIAGGLFLLIHGRDGMNELGQRDLVMTLILLCMTALAITYLRNSKYSFLLASGFLAGFATTIKPTAAVFWLAMLVYISYIKNKTIPEQFRAGLGGLLSFLTGPCLAICYLTSRGVLRSFWNVLTALIPLHNQLLRVSTVYFLGHLLPSTLLPIFFIWVVLVVMRYPSKTKAPDDTEMLLGIGVICGLFSFYIQRKALPYHRYPADAFLLLLACLGFCRALRIGLCRRIRIIGATGLIIGAMIIGPQCLSKTFKLSASSTDFSGLLERDLTKLGGARLDRRVQCIDFTAGCVTTLYRMRLEQSTGYLYDCYLFQSEEYPAVVQYREGFWAQLVSTKPDVVIVSDHDCGRANSFDKLNRWPMLASLLKDQYDIVTQVLPPDKLRWATKAVAPYSYRIYVRHGVALPAID